MGRNYSYELFFPREQFWNVIDSLVDLSTDWGKSSICRLGAQQKTLPWEAGWGKSEIVDLNAVDKDRAPFRIGLYFTIDEEIRQYFGDDLPAISKNGKAGFGIIRLDIATEADLIEMERFGYGQNLILFEFRSPTTSMSDLFEKSPSIRQTFIDLLEAHQGVLGNFNRDGTAHETVFWLDGHEYSFDVDITGKIIPEKRSENRFVISAKAPLGSE